MGRVFLRGNSSKVVKAVMAAAILTPRLCGAAAVVERQDIARMAARVVAVTMQELLAPVVLVVVVVAEFMLRLELAAAVA